MTEQKLITHTPCDDEANTVNDNSNDVGTGTATLLTFKPHLNA